MIASVGEEIPQVSVVHWAAKKKLKLFLEIHHRKTTEREEITYVHGGFLRGKMRNKMAN